MSRTSIKELLGITDEARDGLIQTIQQLVEQQLCHRLGDLDYVPIELDYNVPEVPVRRVNRIG